LLRYNLRLFTDTNSVICKMNVGIEASLAWREGDRVSGGGIYPPVTCGDSPL